MTAATYSVTTVGQRFRPSLYAQDPHSPQNQEPATTSVSSVGFVPRNATSVSPGGTESDPASARITELRSVSVDSLTPCVLQPRLNISMRLVAELADSMEAGRHQPLIEVEPLADQPGRYQIVCGEQRWRAARQAGLREVTVRVLPPLSHRERLGKQLEENRLRSNLDVVEEGAAILRMKTLADISIAERLLREANVAFEPLDSRRITDRDDFQRHLTGLKRLLIDSGVHVVRIADQIQCGPLSPWRETERALGISEAARKQKVGVLRLPPELQEEVRQLPAEHAIQISRLSDREQQEELVRQASELTHRQVRAAVDRLRSDPRLGVDQVLAVEAIQTGGADPLGFERQLAILADLSRQLVRRLSLLRSRLEPEQRSQVRALLVDLRRQTEEFE